MAGVFQSSTQEAAGGEEGGRLLTASGEEALELGEVGGQRGAAELQGGGALPVRVALRTTQLEQSRGGEVSLQVKVIPT